MGEWVTTPLTEVLEFREGPGIMAVDFRDEGVPLIRLAGIKRGAHILDGANYLDPEMVEKRWKQFRLLEGDTLLSTSASLGEVARVPVEGVGAVPYTGIISFRPRDERIDHEFIPHMLTTRSFQNQIEAMGVGSVMKHFGPSHLRQMSVSFPDRPAQRAIAEVLGALDDKIAANDRIVITVNELARALFRRDVTALDGVDTVTLGDLADQGVIALGDGYRTKKAEHGESGYRIVRAGDVSAGRLGLSGPDFVASRYEAKIGPKAVMAGDVVLTTKGTVGRVAVAPEMNEAAVYSPQLCYFRVVDPDRIDHGFLIGWFFSDDLQQQSAVRMYKSDMAPYINLQDIRSLRIPLPAAGLQTEIGRKQRNFVQLSHQLTVESERLAATRDELLPLLMSGKLRVKEVEVRIEAMV